MKLLTKKQQESCENAKICYICNKNFDIKYLKDKNNRKVRDHCHYTGKYRDVVHTISDLKYSVSKKNLQSFRMDQIIIIILFMKELVEEFTNNFLIQEKTLKSI